MKAKEQSRKQSVLCMGRHTTQTSHKMVGIIFPFYRAALDTTPADVSKTNSERRTQ